MKKYQQEYNTPYQLKFPIEIEKIIETTDPVYTFCEVIDHIDLNKYLTTEERRTGRPRYDEKTLLKVILFAFMENGYESLRKIEKLCKTDIRFMWLLQDEPPPSHMTIDNFMNNVLNGKIEEILKQYIQLCGFNPASAVRGRGHHKTPEQRYYDKLTSYILIIGKSTVFLPVCLLYTFFKIR